MSLPSLNAFVEMERATNIELRCTVSSDTKQLAVADELRYVGLTSEPLITASVVVPQISRPTNSALRTHNITWYPRLGNLLDSLPSHIKLALHPIHILVQSI